ncbi:MAG TPA: hypothetical protein PKU69_02460, partial [Bacillota bacterium]|nr:hypothetical protein [Bacillota bacterium]
MAGVIAYPSVIYILEETLRKTSSFESWDVTVFGYTLKLFQPNIYIRYLAKIFVEQKPIGFYGFENSYTTEHISLYISVLGFAYMSYVWFMRDKVSRIYKAAIVVGMIFMFLPLFSYVFSGTPEFPYTRWINMLPIFEIMILAHVFDKYGFEKVKMSYMTVIITTMLALLGLLIYYYTTQLQQDYYLSSRDVLTADSIFMYFAGAFLIILLVFGWLKKWRVVKFFFWVEFVVAIGYAYSGPLSIVNKIDTFQNAHDIEAFLDENIDDDEFYRVYVDVFLVGVEDTNFNRMTGYATNTGIFHSWTDEETNDIGYLLFNSWEYQSKNRMNVYGYYLSHFLSYKYILVDADNAFTSDNQQFELLAASKDYRLYEMKDFSPFKVYEQYMTYGDFSTYNIGNNDVATEKILLLSALLDSERYAVEDFNLAVYDPENGENGGSINSYTSVYAGTSVIKSGIVDTTERLFYEYTNEYLDVDFDMGAMYIKSPSLSSESYGEVYMEFADSTTKACSVVSGEDHQIKCEFFQTPTAIYVEDTQFMNSSPILTLRQERAINAAAYLVYDLSKLTLDETTGYLSFAMNASFSFRGRTFVVDEFGVEHECLDGFYYYDAKPEKLYVYKTADMYKYSNLFYLSVRYAYDGFSDSNTILNQDIAIDKYLTVKNGRIHLQYTNTSNSTYDQLIVIPVA